MDYSSLNDDEALRWREQIFQTRGLDEFYGIPYAMSANMAISRSDFERLGGFDESYPEAMGEDVDLPIRAKASGIDCLYVADAVMAYRLRSDKTAALGQARAYGRGAVTLFVAHSEILGLPTVIDMICEGANDLVSLARSLVRGQGTHAYRWNTQYRLVQVRGLARHRAFWRLARPRPRSSAIAARARRPRSGPHSAANRRTAIVGNGPTTRIRLRMGCRSTGYLVPHSDQSAPGTERANARGRYRSRARLVRTATPPQTKSRRPPT